MNSDNDKILESFSNYVKPIIGHAAWRDWFIDAKIQYEDSKFFLTLTTDFVLKYINDNYKNVIEYAAEKIGIILYLKTRNEEFQEVNYIFNKNYTFENFIVGKSNIMAYEASKRTALSDSVIFNPLFIYGNVGLGKTHLLNAIANYKVNNFPNYKILYLTAEQFMNMFIKAIQQKSMMQFKDDLRSSNLLIIDDFQFLGSKEATQEEFFHTFNALIESGNQIVITADKEPSLLPGVESRLKSRLGWGLVADIHQPDFELKVSILKSKAENLKITVSSEVLEYIAKEINSSVRELEGALLKVAKYSEWTNSELSIDLVKSFIKSDTKNLSHEDLLKKISEFLKIADDDIKSDKRSKEIVKARQKIILIFRDDVKLSYSQIGKLAGGKDHTSIMYGYKQALKLYSEDLKFQQDINDLKKHLDLK